jgi:hypothetical protein
MDYEPENGLFDEPFSYSDYAELKARVHAQEFEISELRADFQAMAESI